MTEKPFSEDLLLIDPEKETEKICTKLRGYLPKKLKRRGYVVGLSGGIDSSVTAALAAKSIGSKRVLALLMPEKQSSEETLGLSSTVADHFGIPKIHEDISEILKAAGFYRRYAEAVREVIPSYGDGWKSKLVIPNVIESSRLNLFSIVAKSPDGEMINKRLPLKAYLAIVAATNFKQRIRKMLEYYHTRIIMPSWERQIDWNTIKAFL